MAITTVVDGTVGILTMLILVPHLGIHEAAPASLIGAVIVGLAGSLHALAREELVTLSVAFCQLRSWSARFRVVFWIALVGIALLPPPRLMGAAIAVSMVAICCAELWAILLKFPLSSMLAPRLRPCLASVSGVSRRLVSHTVR